MKRNGIQLVIRSQRTPVRIENLIVPAPNLLDPTMKARRDVVIYDYVIDQRQRYVLDETRGLAQRHGLQLEVIDLARETPVKRALRRLHAVVHSAMPIRRLGLSRTSEPINQVRCGVSQASC